MYRYEPRSSRYVRGSLRPTSSSHERARSLHCDPFFPQIQDKKWEDERQPWWHNRKSSPSDSTHQDSGNGSIQTSSTLLLGNRNYTSTLMSSGASVISPAHHYESAPHLHATLNVNHVTRCSNGSNGRPKNNQGSSWKRLLSSLKDPASKSRGHLTLGGGHNAHYHHHHLNAENTLRLATHRQLFQFNNMEFPNSDEAALDLHRSAAAGQDNNLYDGLGGHRSNESGLQYYASVISTFSWQGLPHKR